MNYEQEKAYMYSKRYFDNNRDFDSFITTFTNVPKDNKNEIANSNQ